MDAKDQPPSEPPEELQEVVEDEEEDPFDGAYPTAFRSAAAAPILPLEELDPLKVSPRSSDMEFDPYAGEVKRSLQMLPPPEQSLFGSAFTSSGQQGASFEPAMAAAAVSARPEHSLEGLAVLEVSPYHRFDRTHLVLPGSFSEAHAAAAVNAGLMKQGIDFEVHASTAAWKCAHASGSSAATFTVRLWNKDASVVLESSRVSGDHIAFAHLHRSLAADVLGLPKPAPFRAFLPPPPPPGPPAEDKEELLLPAVEGFKTMVASGQVDAACEGAKALVSMSADPKGPGRSLLMHRVEVVSVLLKLLAEKPASLWGPLGRECERLAVTCLAHLSEEPCMMKPLLEAAEPLLERVCDGNHDDRAMRRESARVLRNLCQEPFGCDCVIAKVGKERLQAWAESSLSDLIDEQMVQDAADVRANIQSRWIAV